jgi:hypothetical protein
MKKNIYLSCIFVIAYLLFPAQQSQVGFINKVSETIISQTDTVPIAPILKTVNSYIVSTNQKVSSTQNDIKTIGFNNSISPLWQQLYNVSTKKAFTTATTSDAQGNVYVAGSTYINALNGQDLTVIKFSPQGFQLWVKNYNGQGSNYDIATDIVVDNNGNVFVTGLSVGGLFALVDYVTIKYNSSGTQQWISRYNFSNGMDIPSGIVLDNTGNVIVSGSSASSSNNINYDFATVKYDAVTGSQMQVQRQSNIGNAQDKVLAQTKDANGNLYVTGATSSNGIDYDVQTIKYDQSMNPIWVKRFDGYGKYDQASDIAVDNIGNVIITGYVTRPNLTKELLVINYSSSGNINWKVMKQPQFNTSDAEGVKVKVKNSNEIFIGSNFTSGGNSDISILRFNVNGKNDLEKTYNSVNNHNDKLLDLMVDGNNLIVSGQTNNGMINQNIIVKYEYKDFVRTPITIGSGITASNYISNEVITSFTKKVIKLNAINNKDFTFGRLVDFVQDSTCKKITSALDPSGVLKFDARNLETRKIHLDLTEQDSLSLTRIGDYVKVPTFYCDLLITIPNSLTAPNTVIAINTIDPDVNYCQINSFAQLLSSQMSSAISSANDPYYNTKQAALHPIGLINNANVNVDSAWVITTGTSTIRVGILDTGVEPNHPDLPTNILGFDFSTNTSLWNGDIQNHGTKIAGILAAQRNNNIGVAGIGGGDALTNNQGITIYDCRVCGINSSFSCIESDCAAGILRSSKGTNIGGFGLNALNCSWWINVSYADTSFGHGVYQQVINALNFANRNGVIVSFGKGNAGNIATNFFPADWSEDILMCTGSNGKNGEHCDPAFNNCSSTSSLGGNLDFLAPGTDSLLYTTDVFGGYDYFQGTSAASPHAIGISALMMSYWNNPSPNWNNLLHSDCEKILERTAKDLVLPAYGQKVGYDSVSGWGRINGYRALKAIDKGNYGLRHISEFTGNTGVSNPTINLKFTGTMKWTNYGGVPTGSYITQIFERSVILNYTILPSEQILGYWAMNKECYGSKLDSTYLDADRPYYASISNVTNTSALLTTYYYLIPSINVYMPYQPNQIHSAFTLYTYDPTGIIGIKENLTSNLTSNFKIFPNPSTGKYQVTFLTEQTEKLSYSVVNTLGNQLKTGSYQSQTGINNFEIDLSEFTNGVYFIRIFNSKSSAVTFKLIKY